jgi:hypothetical protein
MNRTVIIGAFVVLLAAGGYYQFSYKPAQEAAMAEEAARKAAEAAAAEAAAAEAAAAAAAEEAAAAAAAAQAEAEAQTAAIQAQRDVITNWAETALDPNAFDPDQAREMIDESWLEQDVKDQLKTAIDSAATNPALIPEVIAQVRAALNL